VGRLRGRVGPKAAGAASCRRRFPQPHPRPDGVRQGFRQILATEGGRQFLASLTSEPSSARTRIVRCTENGIVCAAVGVALLVLSRIFPDLGVGLAIVGTIVTACGVGFLLSCAVSYRLSRSLGLLDQDRGNMERTFLRLRPLDRMLLWLAYVEGAAHREIARAAGVRPSSVPVMLLRARRKLGALLRASGLGPGGR
jgi:hypothetical protein